MPCHRTPGSLPGGWARGQILVHLENVVILLIKIASRQKAFILGQDVHWRLYFYSVASDTRFHARGWCQRSKFRTFKTLVFQVFLGVHILRPLIRKL